MAIYQIILCVCEFCGKAEETIKEVLPHDVSVIDDPRDKGWGDINKGTNRLTCPDCLRNYDGEE
jgi:hypothetical protein